jgi:hypothetical protein
MNNLNSINGILFNRELLYLKNKKNSKTNSKALALFFFGVQSFSFDHVIALVGRVTLR